MVKDLYDMNLKELLLHKETLLEQEDYGEVARVNAYIRAKKR